MRLCAVYVPVLEADRDVPVHYELQRGLLQRYPACARSEPILFIPAEVGWVNHLHAPCLPSSLGCASHAIEALLFELSRGSLLKWHNNAE